MKRVIRAVWDLILREPVYTQGLVVASIAFATAFGLGWSGLQVGAACGLSAALLTVLTRQVVTPISAPMLPSGTEVTVETPAGQPNETVVV